MLARMEISYSYRPFFFFNLSTCSRIPQPTNKPSNKMPRRAGPEISRSKERPWFHSSIGATLTPAGRELLEKYSNIPPTEVESHIYKAVSAPFPLFFLSLPFFPAPLYQSTSILILPPSAIPHGTSSPGPAWASSGSCILASRYTLNTPR